MADPDLEVIHLESESEVKVMKVVKDEILIDSDDENKTFLRRKAVKRYVFSSDSEDDEGISVKKRKHSSSDVEFIIDDDLDSGSDKSPSKKKKGNKKKAKEGATGNSEQEKDEQKQNCQVGSNEVKKRKRKTVSDTKVKNKKAAPKRPPKKKNEKSSKVENVAESFDQPQDEIELLAELNSTNIPSGADNEQKRISSKLQMKWTEPELLSDLQNIHLSVAENIIRLFDTDNTIPFIARYRRELTGNMEAEQLRHVKEAYENIKAVKQRAAFVIGAINKLGKMTPELERSIKCARSINEIEHFYAPYKPGRAGTLADRARKLGLEEFALTVLNGERELHPSKMVCPDVEGLETIQDVITGSQHIISDVICKDEELINYVRDLRKEIFLKLECSKAKAKKSATKTKKEDDSQKGICKDEHTKEKREQTEGKFENYFSFSVPVKFVRPHQVLAINRGENLKVLSVKIPVPEFALHRIKSFCMNRWLKKGLRYPLRTTLIEQSVRDAYTKRVEPLISKQARAELSQEAECASIEVFASNLKALLMAPPVRGKTILGIDPGFRNGCKLAAISNTGQVLHTDVIYPHSSAKKQPAEEEDDAKKLKDIIIRFGCTVIALGNGTACRQTEEYLSRLIANRWFHPLDVKYTIVSEQGASIYSCSPIAKKEFPDMDPNVISAVSLARRLQDPLAELVKVEPRHLGVGMYQHDVPDKKLAATLDEVVSECVSFVGVDANTASECLLRRVAGLTTVKAQNFIEWRLSRGPFINRNQLKLIKGIGSKTFEQCVGFIRIMPQTLEGSQARNLASLNEKENPLDQTWIHPESYGITDRFLRICQLNIQNFGKPEFIRRVQDVVKMRGVKNLSEELECPDTQLQLIVDALQKPPGHDLRAEFSGQLFRTGVNNLESLHTGELVTGAVRNVTHFGVFVDIGVGCNGLIHKSNLKGANLSVGQTVEVKVLSVNADRKRIGLQFERICS